jgi:acetyl esterase
MKNETVLIGYLFLILTFSLSAQPHEVARYKQVDTTQLCIHVYYPEEKPVLPSSSAMVFFFGGGWNSGNIHQFEPHALYLAQRGIVCFLVDYRVKSRHQTSPFESLQDAKSAIRFVRKNAGRFGIDPSKIIAAGGSAGGHLAAATALIKDYNDTTDDLSVSCIPNALVLFNPVIDNGPGGYGFDRIGEHYKQFSPLHNIAEGAPPTLIMIGTEDKLIPVETVQYYKTVMEKVGSRCELILFEGEGHGFFNLNRSFDNYKKTVIETDRFLVSLGYTKGEPLEIRNNINQ